ncbi:hypothetical protein [Gemmatimonas sp.]|jgi:hypothetical protein|uniref:hypothetical protein n=1 Tax=Gemmatimonas sp. TaxID=1962908 RepID=UPI0037C14793
MTLPLAREANTPVHRPGAPPRRLTPAIAGDALYVLVAAPLMAALGAFVLASFGGMAAGAVFLLCFPILVPLCQALVMRRYVSRTMWRRALWLVPLTAVMGCGVSSGLAYLFFP